MSQLSLFDDDPDGSPRPNRAPARATRTPPVAAAKPPAEIAALATGLPAGLRLGTSSWSFPGWAGLVYARPATKAVLSRDGLTAYARHPLLGTVGVDSGFYAPLDAGRLTRWAAQVPADFRFLVKAPAAVTQRRQPDGDGRWRHNPGFLDVDTALREAVEPYLEGLGERAGVLLFQFSPQGSRTDPRRFAEDLYRFLKRLPAGPTYAVELRDAHLLTPDFAAALHHGGAVPSFAAHPRVPELPAQGQLFPDDATGPLVIRWLLRRNRGYDEARDRYSPFDRLAEPDPDTRAAILSLAAAALARGREVFIIVNNKAEGSSPLSLVKLVRGLAGGP
ncbi:hypothetical protein CKO31_19220 [Thiohalocapsa halophila]|uniref:DUF72 domain-containing protein n=1 Tax=Thiohalocapsa halophila TaxID=69359 RepID=A0ABS1CLM8_9GAMM|nr:DUF72 domain-containing protein [Thiohalocapsa halophila]MBK1632839.1 hypothetical protein [Thiohalocapsa halophila]